MISAFPEGGPTKEDLDAVVPDRPVFLMNTDVHGAWVNSKALELGGITAATPDPWDGRIERDAAGEPDGHADRRRRVHVPRSDGAGHHARALARLRGPGAAGAARAGHHGLAGRVGAADQLRAYRDAADAGTLTMRVVAALWWDRHRGLEQIDDLVEQRAWGSGGRVDAGTVKIMLDGCPESGTGAMVDPYHGPHASAFGTGIAFVPDDILREAVPRLDALGFQIHFHALGDRALRMALDALEAAQAANGVRDARHHIAHLQLPDPVDIPRLRRLGVVANMQPYWGSDDEERGVHAASAGGGGAVRAPLPHRHGATQRRGHGVRERLARLHAEPAGRDGGGGHAHAVGGARLETVHAG